MSEFVNPKYLDKDKLIFKKPVRLECLMQDYPRVMDADAKVGITIAPAWLCYSPCKYHAVYAASLVAQGKFRTCQNFTQTPPRT